tara:strand:+ start:100 stop:1296 length:1197 start_codon:yes stop_codon:yes gene_type:complete
MKIRFKNYLILYLLTLFSFSTFYLYRKHNVGNDSTISEWLINYSGGFTKRGIIGEISIFFSRLLSIDLRDIIFVFQLIAISLYFLLVYYFIKNIKLNRIFLLAIFSPIFLLYPIAEIEVLARKEVFIFIMLLAYTFIPSNKKGLKNLFTLTFLTIGILIWEPLIFFIPFWFAIDIINSKVKHFNLKLFKKTLFYLPAIFLAFYIAFNPMSSDQHDQMARILKNEFNESCYMACQLLLSKAGIYQQFQAQFGKYSFEVLLRYFLIYLIGFGPLIILLKNSKLKEKIFFFKKFKNMFLPYLIILSPVIVLHAMAYDWGRWVSISYVFSVVSYFYLYKNNLLILNENKIKNNFISKIKKSYFIFLFIIFCFGWNPKTAITGDVGSFPGYRIPYNAMKIIIN